MKPLFCCHFKHQRWLKLPPGGSPSYASTPSGISTIADLVQICTAPLIISLVIPSRHPDLTLTAAAGVPSRDIDWCISRAPHLVQKKPFVSPLLFGREYVAIAPGKGEGIVKEGKMAVMP